MSIDAFFLNAENYSIIKESNPKAGALVLLRNPGGVTDPTVQFPILKDRGTFNGRKLKIEKWVGPDVFAMIERMQPYNGAGPDKNGLLFIHTCDIADKYKLLVPFLGVPENSQVNLELVDEMTPTPFMHTEIVASSVKDNTQIARVRVSPADSVVDVNIELSINVIFEATAPDTYIVVPALQTLIGIVESVIGDFTPLFITHSKTPS